MAYFKTIPLPCFIFSENFWQIGEFQKDFHNPSNANSIKMNSHGTLVFHLQSKPPLVENNRSDP